MKQEQQKKKKKKKRVVPQKQQQQQQQQEEEEQKWELRNFTHPAMPLWMAAPEPLCSEIMFEYPPSVFALLEREIDAAREREGAAPFNESVRGVARAVTRHELGFTEDQMRAAVLVYSALRKWMRARGEEDTEF